MVVVTSRFRSLTFKKAKEKRMLVLTLYSPIMMEVTLILV